MSTQQLPLAVTNIISIQAPAAVVWDVLTLPQYTRQYMFGCETVSDWQPGNSLLWRGKYEGNQLVFVSGYVLVIEPGRYLKYSVIDPNAAYPHTPENHLNVTYQLAETEGVTTLTVTQDGFETAAEGEKRYRDVYNNGEGWLPMLVQIRQVAERVAGKA